MRMLPRIRPIFPARTSKRFSQNTGFILKYRPLPCRLNARFLEEYNRNDTRNRFGRGTEIRRPNYEQKETDRNDRRPHLRQIRCIQTLQTVGAGIDQDLIAALPQYDSALIARVLANHCRRPRYLKALARGGKRFDLNNRFKGEVTPKNRRLRKTILFVQQALQQQSAQAAAETPSVEAEAAESSAAE